MNRTYRVEQPYDGNDDYFVRVHFEAVLKGDWNLGKVSKDWIWIPLEELNYVERFINEQLDEIYDMSTLTIHWQ